MSGEQSRAGGAVRSHCLLPRQAGDFFLPEDEMVHLRRRQEALRRQLSQQSTGGRPLSRLGTLRDRLSRRISSSSVTPGHTQ